MLEPYLITFKMPVMTMPVSDELLLNRIVLHTEGLQCFFDCASLSLRLSLVIMQVYRRTSCHCLLCS